MEERYYARGSRRSSRIGALEAGVEHWIAGRILELEGTRFLVDESGRVLLDFERTPGGTWLLGRREEGRRGLFLEHGSIVEVHGRLQGGRFEVKDLRVLSTALRPWPQQPTRNWQRWLQDSAFQQRVRTRSEVCRKIRSFFASREFIEVDTPSIQAVPGMEPHLDPFVTTLQHPDGRFRPGYLHTSPEYAMKRLLCGGMERIFQICHVFRNAELGRSHQPEFSMLEWYRAYASYDEILDDCEDLVWSVVTGIRGEARVEIDGRTVSLEERFERLTVAEAIGRWCEGREGAGPEVLEPEYIQDLARRKGLVRPGEVVDHETLFFQLLLNEVEPHLGEHRPTFLLDWPSWQSALARLRGPVAERVELYIGGVELANGFTELTDPLEQRSRFEAELEARLRMGKAGALDEEFLAAMEWGMPPSGGIALGVDRLAALVAGTSDLSEISLLPYQERFEG